MNNHHNLMTEKEFADELKGSLLILSTSSPDKRDIYRLLISSHAKEDHHAGLNVYYTDSGALDIPPRKTPEADSDYEKHVFEKSNAQMDALKEQDDLIRYKIAADGQKFDPDDIKIVGVTEDSGWKQAFDDPSLEKKFIDLVIKELKPKIRKQNHYLLNDLDKTGFPGPNLKPLQENLEGGFNELMESIYSAAEKLHIKELRFINSTNVNFTSLRSKKHFSITKESTGRLLTRKEYNERLMGRQIGEAINSNFVHIPDGQKDGAQKTIDVLVREGLHTRSSKELPASYARRELAEYLQKLIGKRRSSFEERKRDVKIAFVTPDSLHGAKLPVVAMPIINDLKFTQLPTHAELLNSPKVKSFDDAHVIVLIPENIKYRDNYLRPDPNYGLLLNFIVTAETDPESMGVPIILDNRSGGFDKALELISDAFAHGRLMGETPFYVANTDAELEERLRIIKDMKQRAPLIAKRRRTHEGEPEKVKRVPNDGIFTVFIGGGHANNSKRDMEDAHNFGYQCAENGWRIVTGGGSVEGSMGATHTGFIQYHLDQLIDKPGNEAVKASLSEYIDQTTGKYDAEKIILEDPDLIESLAKKNLIPRNMFYAYSMKPLLKMESPSGEAPPGVTYIDAGNRARRLVGLLAPGTKVFMPGSIGTDEEFEETVKQHVEARLKKEINGHTNDNAFADGTPDDQGTMIIYNRNGHLDKLLDHYGLSGGSHPQAIAKREMYRIKIVTSLEELKAASMATAHTWLERVQSHKKNGEQVLQMAV